MTKRKSSTHTQRQIFQALVYSPNTLDGQRWARPKSGASAVSLKCALGGLSTLTSFRLLFQPALPGGWIEVQQHPRAMLQCFTGASLKCYFHSTGPLTSILINRPNVIPYSFSLSKNICQTLIHSFGTKFKSI